MNRESPFNSVCCVGKSQKTLNNKPYNIFGFNIVRKKALCPVF